MTRINVIPVHTLLDEHLLAEWRELPRIPNELIKHPKRLVLADIPANYTMGNGHVKFFRNKLKFLEIRHKALCKELDNRGINRNPDIKVCVDDFTPVMKQFAYNDYSPTQEACQLNIERIRERFDLRVKPYHMNTLIVNCESSYDELFIKPLIISLK